MGIEIKPHPPEVIDVQPEILEKMNRRGRARCPVCKYDKTYAGPCCDSCKALGYPRKKKVNPTNSASDEPRACPEQSEEKRMSSQIRDFTNQIRSVMEAKKLTFKKAGEVIGMSHNYLGHIVREDDGTYISRAMADKIAKALEFGPAPTNEALDAWNDKARKVLAKQRAEKAAKNPKPKKEKKAKAKKGPSETAIEGAVQTLKKELESPEMAAALAAPIPEQPKETSVLGNAVSAIVDVIKGK